MNDMMVRKHKKYLKEIILDHAPDQEARDIASKYFLECEYNTEVAGVLYDGLAFGNWPWIKSQCSDCERWTDDQNLTKVQFAGSLCSECLKMWHREASADGVDPSHITMDAAFDDTLDAALGRAGADE